MQIILIISVLVSILLVLILLNSRQKKEKHDIFPEQKEKVLELVNALKKSKIDIILSEHRGEKHSATIDLLEARYFLDTKRELANEKYDELQLFFTDNSSQIIDFKKFINDPLFPKEILNELLDFYNENYQPADPSIPYFIIITDIHTEVENSAAEREGLFAGSGEAFSSWLSFKEGADNLGYVISQWLKENEEKTEIDPQKEFSNVIR